MQNEDILSVVIITCNRRDELRKTIKSCLQHAGMKCEIIVVDNGSTDGTREMLCDLTQGQDDCVIRPYYSNVNLGVAGGRNKGFELTQSDVVFFIDDDAVIKEESKPLCEAYNYLKNNNRIGALAFEIYDTKQMHNLVDVHAKTDEKCMIAYIGAAHMIKKCEIDGDLYPSYLMYGAEERYAAIKIMNKQKEICYYSDIKICHNPSTKTRMSQQEIHRNVKINQFVVKRLLYPEPWKFLAFLFFIPRMCKLEKFNLYNVWKNIVEAERRYVENENAKTIVSNSCIKLIHKNFGLKSLL